MLAREGVLKELYNYTNKVCAQVCGCQEHIENTTRLPSVLAQKSREGGEGGGGDGRAPKVGPVCFSIGFKSEARGSRGKQLLLTLVRLTKTKGNDKTNSAPSFLKLLQKSKNFSPSHLSFSFHGSSHRTVT